MSGVVDHSGGSASERISVEDACSDRYRVEERTIQSDERGLKGVTYYIAVELETEEEHGISVTQPGNFYHLDQAASRWRGETLGETLAAWEKLHAQRAESLEFSRRQVEKYRAWVEKEGPDAITRIVKSK